MTARGTYLPAPVSEKKVLKASSPPPMVCKRVYVSVMCIYRGAVAHMRPPRRAIADDVTGRGDNRSLQLFKAAARSFCWSFVLCAAPEEGARPEVGAPTASPQGNVTVQQLDLGGGRMMRVKRALLGARTLSEGIWPSGWIPCSRQ